MHVSGLYENVREQIQRETARGKRPPENASKQMRKQHQRSASETGKQEQHK